MIAGRLVILFSILVFSTIVQAQETSAAVGTSVLTTTPSAGGTSPWGVSFFSIGSLTQKQVENGGSSYGINGYLALNYKLSKTKRFSVRPVFNMNTAGLDKRGSKIESGSSLGDAHLVYSDYELASSGPIGVSSSFKLYLPTSEFSQNVNLIAKFRPETFISYALEYPFTLTWVIKPDFFIQSQTTFEDKNSPIRKDGTYTRRTTQLAALEHYLEFATEINKYFTVKPAMGFKEDWYNSGGASFLEASHNTNAKIALAMDFRPLKNLSFTMSAENIVKLNDRRDQVSYFRPEDNSLVLMTNASM